MKYLVDITEINYGHVEVEAESDDEAQEKAEEALSNGEVDFCGGDVEYAVDAVAKEYRLKYLCADGKVWCCYARFSKSIDQLVIGEAPSDAVSVIVEDPETDEFFYSKEFSEEERKELKAR